MTIKQQGGIFGRNPTFNNVTIDGTLTTAGSFTPTGGIDVDGSNLNVDNGNINVEVGDINLRDFGTNPAFSLSRAQGTKDSPTTVGNGQTLAQIRFDGYTGSTYRTGAMIQASASAGISGDEIPTTLRFYTAADGASSPTHNWSIDHNGNLVAVQAGNGIDFSATSGTGTSELFDDYEEGTWTPVLSDATSGGNTATLGSSTAHYVKVGSVVHLFLQVLNINNSGMTGANTLYIQGLPYTSVSSNNSSGSVVFDRVSVSGFDAVTPAIGPTRDYMTLATTTTGAADANLTVAAFNNTASDIQNLTISYRA